jgi:serine/threonine protein kinase
LVRLTDFGIACAVTPGATMPVRPGTLEFKSPEQVAGRACDSIRIDVWALGAALEATLGRMINGYSIYQLARRLGSIMRALKDSVIELAPDSPMPLRGALMRGLTVDDQTDA